MDYSTEYDLFKPYLDADEYVVWRGEPAKHRPFSDVSFVAVIFAIVWLGFSCFWEFLAILSGQWFMIVFGLPFIFIGVSMVFGPIIRSFRLRGKIFYTITNKKLMIMEGENIQIFTGDMLPPMRIKNYKDGTGTIYFSRYSASYQGRQPAYMICLRNLHDVPQAQNALTALMNNTQNTYPNQYQSYNEYNQF